MSGRYIQWQGGLKKKRMFFHDHSLCHGPFQITELSKSGTLGRRGIMEGVQWFCSP